MCEFLSYIGVIFIVLQIPSISGDLSIDQIIRRGNRKLENDIRLVGGKSELEGRVEIRYKDVWGTVCGDGFNRKAAKVVCPMLGYQRKGAVSYRRARFGKGNGPIWLDVVRCYGNETSLNECEHSPFGKADCDHKEDVGVKCRSKKDIRLVGGKSKLKGRVEIRYKNVWGTVCGAGFNRKAAQVVCHMLGYQRKGAVSYRRARFGKGNGPIWLDVLRCYGNETSLNECEHSPFGKADCDHKEDVGVKCRSAGTVNKRREVHELDLVVEGSKRRSLFQRNKGNDRNAVNDPAKVWKNPIPYILGKGVDAEIGRNISDALDEWEAYTCLDFINDVRNIHYNKIVFTSNQDKKGCASFYVGMKQASQEIHLAKDCLDVLVQELRSI